MVVENSTISSNTGEGISNNSSATLTIRGNTINNNGSLGMNLRHGTNVAYANNLSGNNGGNNYQADVNDVDDVAKNW